MLIGASFKLYSAEPGSCKISSPEAAEDHGQEEGEGEEQPHCR